MKDPRDQMEKIGLNGVVINDPDSLRQIEEA